MQLHEMLITEADQHPYAPYVYDHGWRSYGELAAVAKKIAGFLTRELNLHRGDHVALLWRNSAEAVAVSFAVWMSGCVLVPLSTDLHGDALLHQIRHSEARVVVAGPSASRVLAKLADELQNTAVVWCGPFVSTHGNPSARAREPERWTAWETVLAGPELTVPVRSIDIDLATIIYTSGSTGDAKGVMLSHLNLASNTRSIASYLSLARHDRVMMVLPHFYIYGLSLILTHTFCGGSVVIDNRFMYTDTVLEQMITSAVTGFAGVPSTFSILLERSSLHTMRFPALRYVTQAGGSMPINVQRRVAKAFAPATLYVMYGATEAGPRLSYLDPKDLPHKWGSIGRPVPNVDVFVADSRGVPLGPGEEGELVARGSNIMVGYWKDPDGTAEVLRHGLYFTGDQGVMDEDGFLYVTGRIRELLKVKGFRVSPREIEDALTEFPQIAEAAVVGVPDRLLGEAPVAYLVPHDGQVPELEQIKTVLRQRLAPHKIPGRMFVVSSLPRTASGKVDKLALRTSDVRRNDDYAHQQSVGD